jgi:two-component system sensor histidine kinase BaeS
VTRRLVVALVATVAATLVLAGALTLLVARTQARRATEADLRAEATSVAEAVEDLGTRDDGTTISPAQARRLLAVMRRSLHLDGLELPTLGPAGRLLGELPEGVDEGDLDADRLLDGELLSGSDGSLVWAAAPATFRRGAVVAVVTRQADAGLARAARWFLVASVVTLAIGVAVGVLLARRLARPVRAASAAAHRIAAGDRSTRLPEPPPSHRDELAGLARSLNAMAETLERSRGLEQQFLLSVSHDLRTPLTSIRGYAEAITDGTAPDARAAAATIGTEARRLERLVSDLLDLARLDAHEFSLHPVTVDLRVVVDDAVDAFEPNASATGLTVRWDAGRTPLPVTVDPDRLRQVIANLLENAGRYARAAITITASGDARTVELVVDDDGPGIAPDDLPHVFERLYVARHRPVRAESGSGLGLAIVRQLAEAMGGRVEAGVAPGGGARMAIRLPGPRRDQGVATASTVAG